MTLGEIQANPPRRRRPSDSLSPAVTPARQASAAGSSGGRRSVSVVSQLLLTLQISINRGNGTTGRNHLCTYDRQRDSC